MGRGFESLRAGHRIKKMDISIILADLRSRHGDKSVLNAADIARELGRTVDAVYSLKGRDGLPFPLLPDASGPCASIYAVAEWLEGPTSKEKTKPDGVSANSGVPEPKRKRESLEKYLMAVRRQREFITEFELELEKIIVELNTNATELTNADIGRGKTL